MNFYKHKHTVVGCFFYRSHKSIHDQRNAGSPQLPPPTHPPLRKFQGYLFLLILTAYITYIYFNSTQGMYEGAEKTVPRPQEFYCTGHNLTITSLYLLAKFIHVDNNNRDVKVTEQNCSCLFAHLLMYNCRMQVVSSFLPQTLTQCAHSTLISSSSSRVRHFIPHNMVLSSLKGKCLPYRKPGQIGKITRHSHNTTREPFQPWSTNITSESRMIR